MTDLSSRIIDIWEECSKIVKNRFQLEAPLGPNSFTIVSKADSQRMGGFYSIETRELLMTDDIMKKRVPLRGLIFRECLLNSLPDNICAEAKRDLALEFARQYLNRKERDEWISNWKMIPSRRVGANLVYNSFELMTWMHSLGGRKELDSLIHEIMCMFRYGKILNFEQYLDYMTSKVQNIVVDLSHTDVKILDALMKHRDTSYKEIASIAGLSDSWVSTRINRLKRKYVLIEHTIAPFSLIGIRTFHILLAGPSWTDSAELLAKCPFLYEMRAILNGPWQYMARLTVPNSLENIHSLKLMTSILNSYGIACDVAETYSVGVLNSFYHYNATTCSWKIPWVAMEGWGCRIKEESIDLLMERIDYPAKTTDHYLDQTDIRILDLVMQGQTSTRILRKTLSIGQNKLLKRLKKLRSEGLIRRDWGVYNIGLVERVALRATDEKTASLLDAWSRELPRVYLRYEKNRHLLMIVELPLGDSTKMMDTLRLLKWPVTISPLSSGIWGHWQLPSKFWDVEHQRWTAQKNHVESWLNALAVECEKLVAKTTPSKTESIESLRIRHE